MDDYILEFWQANAVKYGESFEASWADRFMIQLEIETIGQYISKTDTVLDVGCANGYSALAQVRERQPKSLVGVDFAGSMIERANQAKAKVDMDSAKSVSFRIGDVRKLDFPDNSFDVVYTTRVIINLPTWAEQQRGIRECLRVAKPGGTVIFSEAFWEPLVRLNAVRTVYGLPPLVEHDFNRYLKKSWLEAMLREVGVSFEVLEFSAVYYLGTRVLREVVQPTPPSSYDSSFNERFYLLEKEYSSRSVGIQEAYVVRA